MSITRIKVNFIYTCLMKNHNVRLLFSKKYILQTYSLEVCKEIFYEFIT